MADEPKMTEVLRIRAGTKMVRNADGTFRVATAEEAKAGQAWELIDDQITIDGKPYFPSVTGYLSHDIDPPTFGRA